MRLCFFNDNRLGLVRGDQVLDVSDALNAIPQARYPFPAHDALIANLGAVLPAVEAAAGDAKAYPLADVQLKSPVLNPGKVVAAPVNYMAHLEEAIAEPETFVEAHVRQIQETGLFLKATSSLSGASQPIRIRQPERRTDHEVELAVIIGRECSRVSRADATDYIAGYSIGLDITVRGPEERSLRKSSDTYTVLGPWLVTADELPDPSALDLALDVNGEARQRANTRDLIMSIPELIEFASLYYTLHPGDILLTGTPEGVGPIRPGEVVDARIENIGAIRIPVVAG